MGRNSLQTSKIFYSTIIKKKHIKNILSISNLFQNYIIYFATSQKVFTIKNIFSLLKMFLFWGWLSVPFFGVIFLGVVIFFGFSQQLFVVLEKGPNDHCYLASQNLLKLKV